MEDSLLRFEKHIKLAMTFDFKQDSVDNFKRLIGDLYNQGNNSFDISDFAYLFKIEDLTDKARINFLETSCNIKFTSITVNQILHRDTKPFTLNLKVRDNLKHISLHYVAFSDFYTEYKEEDSENYYFEKDEVKYEFKKLKLKSCNISVQSI